MEIHWNDAQFDQALITGRIEIMPGGIGWIGWKSIEMMPGQIGQIGWKSIEMMPGHIGWSNWSNWVEIHWDYAQFDQFNQASSLWISTQFTQASSQWIHPIWPVINYWSNGASFASYAWSIWPGIISIDFHPIWPPNLTDSTWQAYNLISLDFHPIWPPNSLRWCLVELVKLGGNPLRWCLVKLGNICLICLVNLTRHNLNGFPPNLTT